MDERTVKLRERNRRRRGQKNGLSLKFAVDILYFAAIVLVIVGWSIQLPVLFLIAGIAMLIGTSYYIYRAVMNLKNNPKKSPEYKDAVVSMIFFGIMVLISIMAIVFAIVD